MASLILQVCITSLILQVYVKSLRLVFLYDVIKIEYCVASSDY